MSETGCGMYAEPTDRSASPPDPELSESEPPQPARVSTPATATAAKACGLPKGCFPVGRFPVSRLPARGFASDRLTA
ncbi:hypothetical protein GCM10027162_41120 [Streptomyces incanus]